jgi:hypothetical protein
VELGLTNTAAARGAVSVGSAARPLSVANVELVLKDLADTKVSSCSVTNTAAARGAVCVGSAARPLVVASVDLVLKDLGDTKVKSFSGLWFRVENKYPYGELRLKFVRLFWVF